MVSPAALAEGIRRARWPARLQRLSEGPLAVLAAGHPLWLDGGHNADAGLAIARHFEQPLHLVLGMLANKNPRAIVDPLADRLASLTVVPVPGSDSHPAQAFGERARPSGSVGEALRSLPPDGLPVLIAGSLYLAGEVLRLNEALPD